MARAIRYIRFLEAEAAAGEALILATSRYATAFASCVPLPSWLRHCLCLVIPLPFCRRPMPVLATPQVRHRESG